MLSVVLFFYNFPGQIYNQRYSDNKAADDDDDDDEVDRPSIVYTDWMKWSYACNKPGRRRWWIYINTGRHKFHPRWIFFLSSISPSIIIDKIMSISAPRTSIGMNLFIDCDYWAIMARLAMPEQNEKKAQENWLINTDHASFLSSAAAFLSSPLVYAHQSMDATTPMLQPARGPCLTLWIPASNLVINLLSRGAPAACKRLIHNYRFVLRPLCSSG